MVDGAAADAGHSIPEQISWQGITCVKGLHIYRGKSQIPVFLLTDPVAVACGLSCPMACGILVPQPGSSCEGAGGWGRWSLGSECVPTALPGWGPGLEGRGASRGWAGREGRKPARVRAGLPACPSWEDTTSFPSGELILGALPVWDLGQKACFWGPGCPPGTGDTEPCTLCRWNRGH